MQGFFLLKIIKKIKYLGNDTDINNNHKKTKGVIVTKKHILIVDDSPTDVQVIKQLLLEIGDFKISVAEDGEIGVKKAEELLPDLILMDVVMPNLNGFRATRILTHNDATAHIPVLIVTTKEQVSDNIWAIRQGACGFMNKPVDKDILQELVLEAIS